jgi:mono/diheme cytochrome c family protein
MKIIFFLLIPFFLFATSTFISPLEYATQLYKNPRGIGCQHCHGANGEGKLIATYEHKNKKKSFRGPAINKVSFKVLFQSLNKRVKGMPRYFLTKKEIQALYLHLHQNDVKELQNAE